MSGTSGIARGSSEISSIAEDLLDHLGGCEQCRHVSDYGVRHAKPCMAGAMLRKQFANAAYSSVFSMHALGTADRKRFVGILSKLARRR